MNFNSDEFEVYVKFDDYIKAGFLVIMNVMSLQRNEIPIENHSTQTKHKRTSLLGSKRDQV